MDSSPLLRGGLGGSGYKERKTTIQKKTKSCEHLEQDFEEVGYLNK